jgi:small subunit ribosomal protein S8
MLTDPIADMLTRIRNAHSAEHHIVEIPHSKLKFNITKVLLKQGFIRSYEVLEGKTIRILLKYDRTGNPVIRTIKRVSRPGLRVYKTKETLPRILAGAGIAVISTSQGLMTDHEARKAGVGGEVLCAIY